MTDSYLEFIMQQKKSLANVVTAFAHWRTNKSTLGAATADFLYSKEHQLFLSLDTPRTVYMKAQYAKAHHLGGLFSWMADYDTGYLLNAAREGAGYQVVDQNVDMSNIINSCGVNITDKGECEALTHLHCAWVLELV